MCSVEIVALENSCSVKSPAETEVKILDKHLKKHQIWISNWSMGCTHQIINSFTGVFENGGRILTGILV